MREYRFYSITPAGHIAEPPKNLDLPDDDAALEQAKKLLDGGTIEVWQGTRMVAHLDPVGHDR